jgi:short-subunit dehydrogenase
MEGPPILKETKMVEEKRMRITIITGASSGLGIQFAREIDRTEKEIDEIWLIARRQERLEKASEGLQKKTRILPLDLLDKQSFETLKTSLTEAKARVGLLIVNAGFAKIGSYADISLADTDDMIDLNCRAAVDTTLTCLPFMKAGDRIIEVCSTAAFSPLHEINVYAASKTFLYHYARALRMELRPRKIIVTALCPYWMKDTEFLTVALKKENANCASVHSRPIKHFVFSVPSKRVAKRALRANRAGFAGCTPGLICTLHRIFGKLVPKTIFLYLWDGFRRL